MYHTQVTWPSQSSAVRPQLLPEGAFGQPIVPQMDVYESKEEIVYIFTVPGIDFQRLEVEIQGGNLAIAAPVLTINPHCCTYRYQERAKGMIGRVVSLVPDADAEGVQAEMVNGLLELRFPKKVVPGRGTCPVNDGKGTECTPHRRTIKVKVNYCSDPHS